MFRRKVHFFLISTTLLLAVWYRINVPDVVKASPTAEGIEFFEKKIRPVLVERCYACHSSQSSPVQAGLLLDSREGMLRGGKTGPIVVPGEPDESLMIKALSYNQKDLKMPPGEKLPDEQIADFKTWIKMGTPDPRRESKAAISLAQKPEFDFEAERKFWAYQNPKNYTAPKVKNRRWLKNLVDSFILARLEDKGLTPVAPADKRTLIRRATYDLIGLPPTMEEIDNFLSDKSVNAFAKVVDRLLASPRYGERWGRYWLDLVRYADTAGDSSDYPIPQAYLYRNYVIHSFNQDKPYDQFLREQIAGDLLTSNSAQDRWEKIVATGYLAVSRRFSVRPEKQMVLTIEDTIDNLGRTVLGLTVNCARCHDHKYDPIPTRDYYALYGIFNSTRYPFAGSENDKEQKDLVYRLPKAEVDAILRPYAKELAPLDTELTRLQEEKKALEDATPDDEDNPQPAGKRTIKQIKTEIEEVKKRRQPIAAQLPVLEKAFAVAEGNSSNAQIQRRGDPKNLGEEVPRRFLTILGGQGLPSGTEGSGRLQLAEWLTETKNPLTARVMVNRIWQHHFGKGLVFTHSEFGKRGRVPTHPELLDSLAVHFLQSRWSVKAMHRLIMLSQTYQLSSKDISRNLDLDPGNELLWKYNRQRLDAESIRDSLLMLSGELDTSIGEAHPFPRELTWGFTQHNPFVAVYETKHRSVYLMTQRFQRHPYLSIFDGPDTNASTPERRVSTTPIQALYMMNSPFVHERSDQFAARVLRIQKENFQRIQLIYRMVLGRAPTREEIQTGQDYLMKCLKKMQEAVLPEDQHLQRAWASYARVLLSSNEFIFVE